MHECKNCPIFAAFELFSKHRFLFLYEQSSVRYLVSISYFTNIAVQNYVNKAFVCIKKGSPSLTAFSIKIEFGCNLLEICTFVVILRFHLQKLLTWFAHERCTWKRSSIKNLQFITAENN